jgi:malate synthase
MDYVEQAGIRIAKPLYEFVNTESLPGTSIGAEAFWSGFAALLADLAPRCKTLLDKRDSMQKQIDAWHLSNKGKPRSIRKSRPSPAHSLWYPSPTPAMR